LDVIGEVALRWANSDLTLISDWKNIGQDALQWAGKLLKDNVSCGIGHGDFAPWNTRVIGDQIYVFDWESMSQRNPLIWDCFHFKAQVMSLLGTAKRSLQACRFLDDVADPKPETVGLLLLYLLHSSANLMEELCDSQHPGITSRAAWISTLLREVSSRSTELCNNVAFVTKF